LTARRNSLVPFTGVEVSALLRLPIGPKRVYDEAGNVIETHEHTGDFKEW
jgi:hypothetical protein